MILFEMSYIILKNDNIFIGIEIDSTKIIYLIFSNDSKIILLNVNENEFLNLNIVN